VICRFGRLRGLALGGHPPEGAGDDVVPEGRGGDPRDRERAVGYDQLSEDRAIALCNEGVGVRLIRLSKREEEGPPGVQRPF
jgi:hypothetical protein